MSDYIPFETQVEIIQRLPVKSVVRFRSVSKQWKALIDSSEFIAAYSTGHTQLLHSLLVWYEEYQCSGNSGNKLVSFVDDESLKSICANNKIDPTALGLLAKQYKDLRVVGSSQGLWCLYESYRDHSCDKFETTMAVLWNPSIRKSVGVVVPGVLGWMYLHTVLGFGVCPITSDPTIVKISNISMMETKSSGSSSLLVEVFTLSTGSWRIPTSKLPDETVTVTWARVAIDKFIYWFAFLGSVDEFDDGDGLGANKLIMSFDMTTHEISLIDLPNSFAHQSSKYFSISKIKESLALLQYSENNEKEACEIWMMNHGVPNMFTKLFTINTSYASIKVLGFMKSGRPIMATLDEWWEPSTLVSYEPCSDQLNYTAIFAKYDHFFVDSYMETLLLLNEQDSRVYSIIN